MRRPGTVGKIGYEDQAQKMLDGPGVEDPVAWNPKVTEAFTARLVAQLGAEIVQVEPLVANVALHPLVSVTPDGAVHVIAQLSHVLVPVFVTVTLAVKPPCQELATV